jgi:hypothetical protein
VQEYLKNARAYRGIWTVLSDLIRKQPHISYRVNALLSAGLLQTEQSDLEKQKSEGKDKDKHKDKG